MAAFLAALSAETAFRRFRRTLPRVPAGLVSRLLESAGDRGAWLALCDGAVVGHAMWGGVPGESRTVELGVVVADGARGRGIGRDLVRRALGDAVAHGARRLELAVQTEDPGLLAAVLRVWPAAVVEPGQGVSVLRVPLPTPAGRRPEVPRQALPCA